MQIYNFRRNHLSAKRKAQHGRGDRRDQNQETEKVIGINQFVQHRKPVLLLPKTLKQEEYIDLLTNPKKQIVFATGPAGTGKTMLAVVAALKAYREGQINRIVITRPAVGVEEEEHGFLPGDLNQKMEPWTRPILDVIGEHYTQKDIARMLDDNVIEISPLAYMRGRTFKRSWVIFDEAQNATTNQVKMALTRLGEGSKMIVTGDLNQLDRKFANDNGLRDFTDRLVNANSSTIAHVNFGRRDVQRHPVVAEVLKLYGDE